MRVAIAGAGSFAKHFVDELPTAGHEVVVLTRSHKDFLDGKKGVVEQRITDYSSVPQLVQQLSDCDALVSTISDMSPAYAEAHLALIEACKQTPKCKRFIPSEFGGNTEEFIEEPGTAYQFNLPVKKALKEQSELEWTVIAIGFLMDYIVPSGNRYHPDIGPLYALDLNTKTMTIPGTGNEVFETTSARDVAKAVAAMLKSPNKWRPYTFLQGEQTTWLQLAEMLKTEGGIPELEVVFEPLDEWQKVFAKRDLSEAAIVAEFKLYVPLGTLKLDREKVKRDRAEFFPNVHFRTVRELLAAVKQDPKVIV
ncbi:Isoflavone reductase [Phytophthora cinnamomi]|uniref:Isoflavone reductase n=1 Tax=Phytophthora cinnamomi TaxID=4785 RepID=UPI003559B309|nr:Isoflavone reductase [Phytophthora cinnamomi]